MRGKWNKVLILSSAVLLSFVQSEMVAVQALEGTFEPGTYQGVGEGHNGEVNVEVILNEKGIESIKIGDNSETPEIAQTAFERLPEQIVKQQNLDVEIVTGATYSSNAIKEAVTKALESAGVDTSKLAVAKQSDASEESSEVEKMETDVVVVGAGAAGTAAALQLSEDGHKVIVLEKAPVPGGASKIAGGIFAVNSKDQIEAGVADTFTLQDILTDWQKYNAYLSDANLFYEVFKNSGETADWLEENGFDFTFVGHEQEVAHAGEPETYHAYADQSQKQTYFENALSIVTERGGKIFYETAATELIAENGMIKGVKAQQADGKQLEISAKKVILATGGAGANAELVKELNGFDLMNINTGTQTGDAISMTQAVGAGKGNTIAELHGVTVPGYNPAVPEREPFTYTAYFPGSISVNQLGSRFVNEDIAFDTALVANAAYAQGEYYYSIISQNLINQLENEGPQSIGEIGEVNYQVGVPLYPQTDLWKGYSESLEKALESGVVVKGETIEELAENLGMDSQTLANTVQQYNEFAKAKKDEMFGKDPLYLLEMTEGPFYAVKTIPASLGQIGGIAVDSQLRVLDDSNKVIENLYITGNDVASIYNNTYPTVEGVTLSFAFNSGRLAAQYAGQSLSAGE